MSNNGARKVPKYCSTCGKPLFKWWVSKITSNEVFLKFDIICNHQECKFMDSSFNNIEIKLNLEDLAKAKLLEEVYKKV